MLKSIEIKKDLQDLQNQIKELFDKGENVPQDLLDKLDDKKDEYMKIMEKEMEERKNMNLNPKKIENKNAVVIGISKDSVNSHLNFATKYNLPFVLLSDSELSAIQAYGVWQEKKLYGKASMGVVRTTYLIDEQGIIQAVMPKVKPDTNADEILALLED